MTPDMEEVACQEWEWDQGAPSLQAILQELALTPSVPSGHLSDPLAPVLGKSQETLQMQLLNMDLIRITFLLLDTMTCSLD